MGARGYTTKAEVAALLGLTFSAAQDTQCDALILDVEAWIDRETRRSWLTGPITDEIHQVRHNHDLGAFVYLKNTPITSVETVKIRSLAFDATDTTLPANSSGGYVVRDLETGLILVSPAYRNHVARVSYTPVATIPEDLGLAATAIVAFFLQPALGADSQNVESYSLPDLTVKFAPHRVPSQHRDTVLGYRRVTVA